MTSKTYSKISQTFSILRRTTARAVLLTLVMVGGTAVAWAQAGEDRSGFYYIANYNNNGYSTTNLANNYYLCPSTVYYDGDGYQTSGDMPYLTTDKTGQVSDSKWQVTYVETIGTVDYYYIKHVDSGKYLTFNTQKSTTENRLRVHLQSELATNGDALFCFYLDTARGNSLSIRPKSDASNRSLNPANGNKDGKGASTSSTVKINDVSRNVGGMIGLFKADDANSVWYLEEKFTRPTITYNGSDQVEMACSKSEAKGSMPRYTPSMQPSRSCICSS